MIDFRLLIVDPDGLRDRGLRRRLGIVAAPLSAGLTRQARGPCQLAETTAADRGPGRDASGPARARASGSAAIREDLPGFARSTFEANHETLVVDEALARISSDYYRPIAKSQLANASISGAVASLGDRFSHYLTPQGIREFDSPPSFTGIGVVVDPGTQRAC